MTNFEKVTASPEALGAFLASLPVATGPWDESFHREFTARKRAGLLTPGEQETEKRRLAHSRAWQRAWREKRKASQPEKPRKRSLEELAKLDKEGADLTPEETERLEAHRRKRAEQARRRRAGKPAADTPA